MGVAYVTAADIAATLDDGLPELARLAAQAGSGSTTLVLDRPVDVPIGATLLLGARGTNTEVASVQGAVPDPTAATSLTLAAPLAQTHLVGEALEDVTALEHWAQAASRLVDAETLGAPEWFAAGVLVDETIPAQVNRDGNLKLCTQRSPIVSIQALTLQQSPMDPIVSVPVANVWAPDSGEVKRGYSLTAYLANIGGNTSLISWPFTPGTRLRAVLSYTAGFAFPSIASPPAGCPAPPADLVRFTAVLAARLWKEKDSGFSDVIGDPTTVGQTAYRKAIPADVRLGLAGWKRQG